MSEANGMNQDVICGKENSETLFYLKKANSTSTALIEVDFSPSLSQTNQPLLENIKLTPVFNKDGRYYTPAFIIEGDQKKYQVNDQGYHLVHEKKVREMVEEKTQIFVPRPSKANSYCCICKTPFDDYLTHINIPKHRQLLKGSPYYNLIANLCSQQNTSMSVQVYFQKNESKTHVKTQRKTKKISKTQKLQEENMPKRGRGRPKKQLSKLDSLASISTNISIEV